MSFSLPRISIVTPSYNQGHFIEQTIHSVLEQDYPNLEYIVMDGGSTDETLDILRKYDGQLRWFSEKDRGQSHAINKGLKIVTGEVVAFINSDDYYAPGALLTVGEYFARHLQAYWVTGKCHTVDVQGCEIRKAITLYKNFLLLFKSFTLLRMVNHVSQPATFWRREVMDEVGYFDESLHYAMEYDFWMRVGQKHRLDVINRYLAYFRIHPTSKAGSSASAQFDVDLVIALRYIHSPLYCRLV